MKSPRKIIATSAAALCLTLGVIALPAWGATQTTYYATPSGSGSICSQAAPCTMEGAQKLVAQQAPTMTGDITVSVADGTYNFGTTWVLTAADSGRNGHRITWAAAPGAKPIISGGQNLGAWSPIGTTGAYQTSAGAGITPRELYVNGQTATRSSLGAGLPGTVTATSTGYTTTSLAPLNWANPTGIELIWNQPGGLAWKQLRCGIASITNTGTTSAPQSTITMAQPCFTNVQRGTTALPNAAEGSPTWLQPGTWAYAAATNTVMYRPRTAETITAAIIPRREKLVELNGTPTNPISNLTFDGLTFAYATWNQPNTGDGAVEAYGDLWETGTNGTFVKTLGNVSVHAARSVNFTNNTFTHLGGAALAYDNGSQNALITGNIIADTGATGILIGDVQASTATANLQNTDLTISNNYLTHTGQNYPGTLGIYVMMAARTAITHNYLTSMPYSGISTGYNGQSTPGVSSGLDPTITYATGNTIAYNRVENTMQKLADGGAIYTWGPGTTSTGIPMNINNNWVNTTHGTGAIGLYSDSYYGTYQNWFNNVVQATSNWLLVNTTNTSPHITISNNYADNSSIVGAGPNNATLANNTTGNLPFPAPANTITSLAGLEPAYAPLAGSMTTVDNAQFAYAGAGWTNCAVNCNTTYKTGWTNGTVSYSTTPGNTATITFTGTQLQLRSGVGSNGTATVSVDNLPPETIKTTFATTSGDAAIWTSPLLTNGTHTVTVTVSGDNYIALDGAVIYGPSARLSVTQKVIDDVDPAVTYTGTSWHHCTSACNSNFGTIFSNGTVSYNDTVGQSLTYTWSGRQIQYLAETGLNGYATVSIDGGPGVLIDEYSSVGRGQVLVYQSPNLPSGSHTITVTVSGQQPPNTTSTWVTLDGFVVLA